MKTKVCTKCGEEKPATTEHFHTKRSRKDGLTPACKKCNNEAIRIRRKKGNNKTVNIRRSDGDIVYRNFKCKICGEPTRHVYVHKDDVEKMKDKYFCNVCNGRLESEEELYYGGGYERVSEMTLIDTPSTPIKFGVKSNADDFGNYEA